MRLKIRILLCLALFKAVLCYVEKQNENLIVERTKETEDYSENDKIENRKDEGKKYVDDSNIESSRNVKDKKFMPDWEDLDTRRLPEWYDKAKIGIFMHWGVYSVPGFGSEWFWYYWRNEHVKKYEEFMVNNYAPGFTYQEFGPMFKAEFFDPKKFADLFVKSGAKYVVLTSKHHDGYTLFPSKRSFSWNSVDVGPHRDLVKDLADAVRQAGLKFGVYHSLYEWFNPIYLEDKANNFETQNYVFDKLWHDIKQLINDYHPSVLWSDGDWEAEDTYWNSTELLAWLYNDSPVKDEIVVNDRWGKDTSCKHGDFYNCEDRFNPGKLQNHKWENAFTLDKHSWGYQRQLDLDSVLTLHELLTEVVSTVSCGGNALINIGPTKEGTIVPIFEERLLDLGEFLKINGEAIYGSSPWIAQNDTMNGDVWYTCTKKAYDASRPTEPPAEADQVSAVYATFLEWPINDVLYVQSITDLMNTKKWQIELLGNNGTVNWVTSENQTAIVLPPLHNVTSKNAWTLRLTPL